MRTIDRRERILQALNLRRQDTIMNLANEFSASERTIRRDVEELTLAYPLETLQGRYGGGVRMQDGYYLGRKFLKPQQRQLLQKLAGTLSGADLRVLQSILSDFSCGSSAL